MAVTSELSLPIIYALITVSVVFPALSLVSILLRFRARRLSKQPFAEDDWTIVATWILTMPMSIVLGYFVSVITIDLKKDSQAATTDFLKCSLIIGCLGTWALTVVKISVLLLYNRIFSVSRIRVAIRIGLIVVSCWGLLFFLLVLLQGDPIDFTWGARPGRLRYNAAKVGHALAGSSIALDVCVLCFPIPLVLKLRMGVKQKLSVIFIFLLGLVAVFAATSRLVLLARTMQETIRIDEDLVPTQVRTQSLNGIITLLEPNCSIIAACLPCYGPLFRNSQQQHSFSGHGTPRKAGRSYARVKDSHGERESQIELEHRSKQTVL